MLGCEGCCGREAGVGTEGGVDEGGVDEGMAVGGYGDAGTELRSGAMMPVGFDLRLRPSRVCPLPSRDEV